MIRCDNFLSASFVFILNMDLKMHQSSWNRYIWDDLSVLSWAQSTDSVSSHAAQTAQRVLMLTENWPCRNRSTAAAWNMWPQSLPGSPLGVLHYSLFHLSPCCCDCCAISDIVLLWQEHVYPSVYPQRRFDTSILHGGKALQLKSTSESLNWCWVSNNHLWHHISTACQSLTNSNSDESTNGKVFKPINTSANLHAICQRLYEQEIVTTLS